MKSQKAEAYIDSHAKRAEERIRESSTEIGKIVLSVRQVIRAVEIAETEVEDKVREELTRWNDIPIKDGFATDEALDEIFSNLPRLVRDKRDGCIELINHDNSAEWRGDLERHPDRYQWRQIIE